MNALRHRKVVQTEAQLMAGADWDNKLNLVFTNELGQPLKKSTVYRAFKKAAAAIGLMRGFTIFDIPLRRCRCILVMTSRRFRKILGMLRQHLHWMYMPMQRT